MKVRDATKWLGILSIVVVAFAAVSGAVLGQPVLLSFVETGSMQPSLDPGDGFVAIPKAVAAPVEPGDVVVYDAENLNGGGLTTHRVVDTSERGYITKGDANTFTDQPGEEPPVKDAQIVAVALQINGRLVVIPHLGTVVESVQGTVASFQRLLADLFGFSIFLGMQGFVYLLFVVSIVGYAVDAWRDRGTKERRRTRSRNTGYSAYVLVAGLTALIVIAATASMIAPAGVHKYGVVSAEFDSPGPRVIPTGESETTTYPVRNAGTVPVVVFLEPGSEGIDIQPREVRVDRWSIVNTTVTLSAPPETGYYRRFLVEHRYLALLPPSTIRTLYHVHPWLPIVVIDALIGVPFYVLGVALVGTGRIRSRSRPNSPARTKRLLNRFT